MEATQSTYINNGYNNKKSINCSATSNSSDILEDATAAVENLYIIRDTYFPRDSSLKKAAIHQHSKTALSLLDSIPPERRQKATQRATYEYLRGKALDASPEYCREAEEHLSKSVKLNPSLADAWLALGNCFWKKGDLDGAKNCFLLSLKKCPSKKILCQLSMLERQLAKGTDNEEETVEESIQHAKQAVLFDVKDGQSWYALGNAYLSSFFITGAWDQSKLYNSLKAYQNAEKDEFANKNPDLFFNCAMVNRYLENYERALTGFEAASIRDPGLGAEEEVENLVQLLHKLEALTVNKGQMKSKKFASIVSSLKCENVRIQQKLVTIKTLQEGVNDGLGVLVKVLLSVKHESRGTLYYVICDSVGNCCVLSVYGLQSGVIKESDTVTLLDPIYRNNRVSWKNKVYDFNSIRVDFIQQILLNGHALSPTDAVSSTIHAQHIVS